MRQIVQYFFQIFVFAVRVNAQCLKCPRGGMNASAFVVLWHSSRDGVPKFKCCAYPFAPQSPLYLRRYAGGVALITKLANYIRQLFFADMSEHFVNRCFLVGKSHEKRFVFLIRESP